jgi:hypothetical protein
MKIFFIILLLLISCTRQVRHFNEPVKTSRFLDYDTDSVYLYIPSTLGAPRKIVGMKPFSKGSEQLKLSGPIRFVYSPMRIFGLIFKESNQITIPGI